MKTVVGLYKTVAEANSVKATLSSNGYTTEHMTVIDQSNGADGSSQGADQSTVGGKIKHFFSSFTGSDEKEHEGYTRGVSDGGALLAVTVADEQAEATADMLFEHGATGIEGDYSTGTGSYAAGSSYGEGAGTGAEDVAVLEGSADTSYRTAANTNTTAGQVIPVVAEELVVGKREVSRGGVRIYSHLVETPVSEQITLRDERVVMDRRAVDRPATEADFATGTGAIEVTASGEEAVVGKTSRVVEEVSVGKQASEHTEQINDTVRHTEVDVEPVAASTTTTGTTTGNNRY